MGVQSFEETRDTWTEATIRSWEKAETMMTCCKIGWFFQGEEELLVDREERRKEAPPRWRIGFLCSG